MRYAEDVQRTCDAILSQRSCMGDERRRLGPARARVVGEGRCPFGCVEGGVAPRFTWFHAQFRCGECSLVACRRAWVECLEEEGKLLLNADTSIPHEQCADVLTWARKGLPRTRGGPIETSRPPTRLTEQAIRRFTGGLVRCTGNFGGDRSKGLAAAVRRPDGHGRSARPTEST